MSEIDLDQNAAIATAKGMGYTVVRSAPTLLLIDLDGISARTEFKRRLPEVQKTLREQANDLIVVTTWKSASGKGRHYILQLEKDVPVVERMLLQAILCSDWKRELLCLMRKWTGLEEPLTLFKPTKKSKSLPKKKAAKETRPLPAFRPVPSYNPLLDTDDDIPF